MNRKVVEKEIREHWFKDHVAELEKLNDRVSILNWHKPGTVCYSCRYVFDGSKMYISGDIGEAVFCLTWKADVYSFNGISIGYFMEKLSAYSNEKYDFNSDNAVKRLREWLKDMKEYHEEYDHDEMRELFEETRGCSEKWEWVETIHKHDDFISELDPDYWEWMYNCGDEIPWRIYGYLIGLQMASEQLKAKEE